MKNKKLNTIKSSGFKTPDHYFESFDEKLFSKLETESVLKAIENSGFTVPKNYFDTVETSILKSVENKKETKVVPIFSRKKLYYISGVAASFLLLFSIFINKQNTEIITAETVEYHLSESDLDSYDLAQLLTETDMLEENFNLIDIINTEENLETYLLDNADIESIIE